MQNLKRVLSLVLVIAMVASFMLTASAAPAEQISDLSESKYQPEVRVLNALGIVEGYEDGSYKPGKDVTRAELAMILARVKVGGDKAMINSYNYGHMTYTDVVNNGYGWAAPGIQYCTDNGMVVGDGNGKYRPGDTVTIVEALKMILGTLGYDAQIEGLQNVGAAWKANTLSLAKEVGLMDRFYGDTNKNCTRDDIALLIYNFLFSKVVKGYFNNDVANVDTIIYAGGTALELYFGKQIIYGVIVANQEADLDLYEYALTGDVANNDVSLNEGYTQLYLYDRDDALSLRDIVTGNYRTNGNRTAVVEDAFETVRLTSGHKDIGESVFIITDLEKTKGYYTAVGDLFFSTGVNEVGTETWDSTTANALRGLISNDTIYVNDYDSVDARANTLLTTADVLPNGNGNFLKTVDFDGDGKLDFVMVENWAMDGFGGVTKRGEYKDLFGAVIPGRNVNNTVATDDVTVGWLNYHVADGIAYTVKAETLAGLSLANTNDAVNYKEGYVTLSNEKKYYQSEVGIGHIITALGLNTVLIDAANDPYNLKNYTWYLDCGGYVRAYGLDKGNYGEMHLLTDATSVKTGRTSFDKTVDTYKQSSEKVTYTTSDPKCNFVKDGDFPYGEALTNTALNGKAVTNLAAGVVNEKAITLADATKLVDAVVELRDLTHVGKNAFTFATTDCYGKYGDYNMNNGGADAENVFATTETDYYYVVLDKDRYGVPYVKSVEFFDGYLNVKGFDFSACTAAYAAVNLEKDATGANYYNAKAVVLETYENTTNVTFPYFAYEHISSNRDYTNGVYSVVTPAGALDTMTVTKMTAIYDAPYGNLGFYTFNGNNGVATKIVENWADYGISAHTVIIDKGAIDYYVLDSQSGKTIKLSDETPVYAVMNQSKNNDPTQYKCVVAEYDAKLTKGDKIILVEANNAIKYVLVVDSTTYDLGWNTWAAQDLWTAINANAPLYSNHAKYDTFKAAVEAYAANKTDATYEAMLQAALVLAESNEEIPEQDAYTATFIQYFEEVSAPKYGAFCDAVDDSWDAEGNIVIDLYLDDKTGIAALYKAMSPIELKVLDMLSHDEEIDMSYLDFYREVADKYVATAKALIAAKAAVEAAQNPVEQSVAEKKLVDTYNVWVKLTAGAKIVAAANGELAAAITAAQALIPNP